jgi:hypothetical protein
LSRSKRSPARWPRIAEVNVDFQRTMGEMNLLLENLNITRHNEILGILHRLDETEQQRGPPSHRSG